MNAVAEPIHSVDQPVATRQATFVLVHGAWAGAWGWSRVRERLLARGHRVHVPTLSGVGERSHLPAHVIGLGTHIDDVVNEILWHDLDDVVLVGHSYAGFVVTGVAERIGERLSALVYVEAFIPEDGQCFADLAAWLDVDAPSTPAPPAEAGDYRDDADRLWVNAKATAQPTATFTERLRVTGAYQRVARKAFVRATGWDGPFDAAIAMARSEPDWTAHEIDSGHDIPVDNPNELARVLESCAGPDRRMG